MHTVKNVKKLIWLVTKPKILAKGISVEIIWLQNDLGTNFQKILIIWSGMNLTIFSENQIFPHIW